MRRALAVLLFLVMLSSIASPAMAIKIGPSTINVDEMTNEELMDERATWMTALKVRPPRH